MNNYELIEAYFENRLPKEEKSDFEQQLSENTELATELEAYKFAMASIDLAAEVELAERIKELSQTTIVPVDEEEKSEARTISMTRWTIPVGIAAAVLVLISFFLFRPQSLVTYDTILDEEYTFTARMLRNSPDTDSPFQKGITLMNKQEFEAAAVEFETLVEVDSLKVQATYYLAHAYFKLEDYSTSRTHFQAVIDRKDQAGHLFNEAKWYYLLTKVGDEQLDEDFYERLDQLKGKDNRVFRLIEKLNLLPNH